MSVGDGIRRPSWSDLPDDNLADVYHRLSSAPDRARFACVCTSWRRITPPPLVPVLLPWTTQGSDRKGYRRRRALDLESGMPTRVQLPWFARDKVLVGSYNRGWVAAVSKHNQLMIINLSSGAQLPLSNKQRIIGCTCMAAARSAWTREVQKIIFSDYPDSSSGEGCILAAITVHLKLAVCRVSSPDNGWLTQGCGTDDDKLFMDIAFCKGELYGLVHHQVYKFQIGARKDSPHVVTTAAVIPIESSPYVHKLGVAYHIRYIFELHGKLTMALQADYEKVHRCEARYFVVLMLDATPCGGYMWTEVTTLGDNALFLSPTFSQAMEVPPEGLRSEVERNHIYYFIQHDVKPASLVACLVRIDDLGSFDVYHWDSHVVHRRRSLSVDRLEKQFLHHRGIQSLHWGKDQVEYSWKERVVRVAHHQEVQGLRQCLDTIIPSRGYHYMYNYKGVRDGCMWLFMPRDI